MGKRLLDHLPELMKDPAFVDAWEEAKEEYAIAREIIHARANAGLTQKDLAEKIGTTQSVIARLESGTHTPSVATLKRIASAVHAQLSIRLTPWTGEAC